MAYDSYPKANDPPGYDPANSNHLQNPYPSHQNDGSYSRSRQSSRDRSELRPPQERPAYPQPRRPIAEAVNHAFDDARVPGISQEVMAQITQNVIEQLKKSGTLGGAQTPTVPAHPHPLQPPTPQHPPPAQQQHFQPPPSPSMNSNGSPPPPSRNNFTPPSPSKHTEQYPPDSPHSKTSAAAGAATSPMRTPEERRPSSRTSNRSDTKELRPKPVAREPSSKEETTLEKIWGQLFDMENVPTARLKQFLRGLAVHLVITNLLVQFFN